MYDPKSMKAEEFISHEEILDTLAYAQENKSNEKLIDAILEKAKLRKGLSHREASVLLACEMPDKIQQIYALAEQLKKDFSAIVLSCLRLCICPITVSMAVCIVLIMPKTNTLLGKN